MSRDVTTLLHAWADGDEAALDQLLQLVETELRRLARGYLRRERHGHTLQPTALVNEAFMRILDAKNVRWNDRSHFMSIAARLMRRGRAPPRNASSMLWTSRSIRRSPRPTPRP
jgi:RNA polymerase sigma-70 factor (ECF subfamily)